MHVIHNTKGIVLHKRAVGEASSAVFLLTEDHGLIKASAKSSRKEVSKLRYGLEPLTAGTYSLVRGKYEWKITGTHSPQSLITHKTSLERRKALGRISKLLMRLIAGEEPTPALFGSVSEGLIFLVEAKDKQDAEAIEVVLVLRILAHLGYLPKTSELEPFVANELFSLELAAAAAASRTLLIRAINTSLEATGL